MSDPADWNLQQATAVTVAVFRVLDAALAAGGYSASRIVEELRSAGIGVTVGTLHGVGLQAIANALGLDRAAVLREALDAVPQDICTHDGCEETTCPLTRVNVAISGLLVETPLRPRSDDVTTPEGVKDR